MYGRVLVTGGAGFIGSHLSRALLEAGATVRILDNFSTGSRANLAEVETDVDIVEGDLRDVAVVRKAVAGCAYVVHLGALGSVPRSIEDPLTTHDVNATGTLNVLVASRDAEVERVVYASSSSIYGDSPELPKREAMRPAPISPYAVSKHYGEAACRAFVKSYGLEAVALRYFNVFGPRQSPSSQYAAVIPRFIAAVLDGEPPIVYGDGTQSRDFTYVENVVEANLRALLAPASRAIEEGGGVFNIACEHRTSLLELIAMIEEVAGREVAPVFEPSRPGDVKHSQASIERAAKYLDFAPRVSLRDGLRTTVEWFQMARNDASTFELPAPGSRRSGN